MKKTYTVMVFLLTILITVTGCSAKNKTNYLTDKLGIDFSAGTVVYNTDSHGGFHGDGTTFIKLTIPPENIHILDSIKSNKQWTPLPLPDDITTLIYGKETETEYIGPYIPNDEPFFPEIKNGYYFFKDRQNDDTDILSRNSFNFTVALFDADENTLYYCKQDT